MEILLASYVIGQRQMGMAVTTVITKNKAMFILHELDPEAKLYASTGWLRRFLKRQNLLLSRSSTLNQTDLKDLDEMVLRFLLHFREIKAQLPTMAPGWGCDETPVF